MEGQVRRRGRNRKSDIYGYTSSGISTYVCHKLILMKTLGRGERSEPFVLRYAFPKQIEKKNILENEEKNCLARFHLFFHGLWGLCLFLFNLITVSLSRYGKYKPLSQPGKCCRCHEKKIKYAYHTVCGDCVDKLQVGLSKKTFNFC